MTTERLDNFTSTANAIDHRRGEQCTTMVRRMARPTRGSDGKDVGSGIRLNLKLTARRRNGGSGGSSVFRHSGMGG